MDEHLSPGPQGVKAAALGASDADACPHCGEPVGDVWLVCAWCGGQLAAPPELPAGSVLAQGRYEILGTIGRGGFAITYEAGDTRLRRRVAIKELFPEHAVRHGSVVLTAPDARAGFRAQRERFLREARVLARFTHPGIVSVYEVFEEHGTAYLVMERLGGRTLLDLLVDRDRPLDQEEVLEVAARAAAALRPVHQAGVLHRDLSPDNIVLTEHGRVVLIDFGLAREFDIDVTMGMTRAVTPGYGPIEQYRGEARFGPSTDVYGLAATCYRLATGRVPVAAVDREGGATLPSVRALNPAIAKAVSDAIGDGLEVEPGHRPQDLDAFLARLGVRRLPDDPRSSVLGPLWLPPPAPDAPVDVAAPAAIAAPRMDQPPVPEAVMPTVADDATRAGEVTRAGGEPTIAWTGAAGDPVSGGPDGGRSGPSASPGPGVVAGVPGRWKVTWPLAAVALAAATAVPLLALASVVFVALPALATAGDLSARRLRAEAGIESRWSDRRSIGWLLVATRFAANLVVSVVRVSPIIGIAAVVVAGWFALSSTDLSDGLLAAMLAVIGAGTMAAVLAASREGSARFRVGLGTDALVRWFLPEGRTDLRLVVGWILALVVVVGALWLSPDPFPL